MALCEKNGLNFFDSQLVCYISQGENEKAHAFLDAIENPYDLKNSAGQTLLHIASRYGNAAITKHLIALGSDVNTRDKFGVTALILAVQHRRTETIAILLNSNADIYDSECRSCPLQTIHSAYMATTRPRKDIKLIWNMFVDKVRADHSKDKLTTENKLWSSKCSLHLVVMILGDQLLRSHYIKSGYDLKTPEPSSQCTALHGAVERNHLSAVKLLVENSADVNALNRLGRTPLCYYDCNPKDPNNELEILEYLIAHGATLTLDSSSNSISPLEYLLTNGNINIVKTVLENDIDLKAMARIGMTPLHFLANNSCTDVMLLLDGKTFDVDARDDNGNTPLMLAILKNKNLSSVEFLLNKGADVNAEKNEGQTPLCCSVKCALGKKKLRKVTMDICKLLLQRGANIQHVFKTYKKKKVLDDQVTIFDWILSNNQFQTSMLLISQLTLNNIVHNESITNLIRTKIESDEVLKEQFNSCNKQIEKMKAAKINESLSLFDLMTGKEEDLLEHVIDFEFESVIDELIYRTLEEKSLYREIIKKRVADAVKNLKSAKEVKNETDAAQSNCCIS